jgi:hypothetical protein
MVNNEYSRHSDKGRVDPDSDRDEERKGELAKSQPAHGPKLQVN